MFCSEKVRKGKVKQNRLSSDLIFNQSQLRSVTQPLCTESKEVSLGLKVQANLLQQAGQAHLKPY
jgi:hypothetical protein